MTLPTDSRLWGQVRRGLGVAGEFLSPAWVRAALTAMLAAPPVPGTLNLQLIDAAGRQALAELKAGPSLLLPAGEAGFCDARCYRVRVGGLVPALVLVPEVADYPDDKVEVVAALPLRQSLGLAEGSMVELAPEPAPPRLKAVLLDVDGTLLDSAAAYRRVLAAALAEVGLTHPAQDVVAAVMNCGHNVVEAVLPAGASPAEAERLRAALARAWQQIFLTHVQVLPGVGAVLATLCRAGLSLGIVTASSKKVLQPLDEAGLLKHFAATITMHDVQRQKPHPEPIFRCLQALDATAAEAVLVGDTPLDVQAGQAAGLPVYAVTTGTASPAMLAGAGPDLLLAGLAQLPLVLQLG